jgi:hypothetical protein
MRAPTERGDCRLHHNRERSGGCDLEKLAADGAAGGVGELGRVQGAAIEASHRRSWLARMVADEVRSASLDKNYGQARDEGGRADTP